MQASSHFKSASIEAVKILADGTRVPLGTIAYYHRNPIKMMAWHAKQALKNTWKGLMTWLR